MMKTNRPLVTLEPALEDWGAGLWTLAKCRRMARIFRRWAHQLDVKVAVLTAHLDPPPPPPAGLRPPRRLLVLN